jgi:1-acyl-sn-glycerol-3-phosphate acyltransferase
MEKHLRAWGRLAVILSWTAIVYTMWVCSRVLLIGSARLARRSHARLTTLWATGVVRALGISVEVRGEPPRPPFFLVSNHLSYVDIPVFYSRLATSFVAKSEISRWPLIGFLASTTGTLFLEREHRGDLTRVLGEVGTRLQSGLGVVVFPEGTSTRGDRVLPFKSSLFEIAVRTGSPVSYACIGYRTPPGSPPADQAVCWWGDMSFLPHVYRLLTLPSFQATLTFGPEPLVAGDRKTLASRAHEAVESRFTPVVGCRAS